MKKSLFILALIALSAMSQSPLSFLSLENQIFGQEPSSDQAIGGGYNCVACVALVSQSNRAAAANNLSIADYMENHLCPMFKAPLNSVCTKFMANYGAQIIKDLQAGLSPDQTCLDIQLCVDPTCLLWPNKTVAANAESYGI